MSTLDLLFNGSNLFVLPFWLLMAIAPNWSLTRKVMASYIPFVLLAAVYLYLFVTSLDPESAAAFSNPQLSDLARLFSDETVMATGWTHFVVLDLFVGRWIYWQGQASGAFVRHSLVLCLFAGPLGLLSHIVSTWIGDGFKGRSGEQAETSASDPNRGAA